MICQSLHKFPIGAALVLGLLAAGAASAHHPSSTLSGKAAAGDSVTIRNIATEHKLDAVVAKNGRFRFCRLPIGIYEVVIHHQDGTVDSPILARARLGETVRVN